LGHERCREVQGLQPVGAGPEVVRIGAFGGLAQNENQLNARKVAGDSFGRGAALEVIRTFLARELGGPGRGEPGIGVVLESLLVKVVDEKEFRLRRDGPGHEDIRMAIQQRVKPRRSRPRRAPDDEVRQPQNAYRASGAVEAVRASAGAVCSRPSVRSTIQSRRPPASSATRRRYSPRTPIINNCT